MSGRPTFLARCVDTAVRHRLLERTTLGYVLLPFLIFALGWLKPLFAVPITAVALFGLYRAQLLRRSEPQGTSSSSGGEPRVYLVLLGVVVGLLLFSGTGAYAVQGGGHLRANAFLRDLIEFPWPLGFAETGRSGEPGVLAFYVANALLPALFGRAFGWAVAHHASFLWTVVGVFLALCWFLRVAGRVSVPIGLLFLLFGGLDVFGQQWLLGEEAALRATTDATFRNPDIWIYEYAKRNPDLMGGTFWLFPSNLWILYSSPHHVLAGWLATLLVLDDAIRRGSCHRVGFVAAPALLWSAFSFVGLAPFVVAAVAVTRARGLFSFENLVAGPLVLLVLALYLTSNNGDYLVGPLWAFQDLTRTAPLLLLVILLEFGLFSAFALWAGGSRSEILPRVWWITALLWLLFVPWVRLGDFCDFTTKAGLPALLVLQVWLARTLVGGDWRRPARLALAAALLVGWTIPGSMLANLVGDGLDPSPPRLANVRHTNQISPRKRGAQLFSDGGSFFWRVLAREVHYQDVPRFRPRREVR